MALKTFANSDDLSHAAAVWITEYIEEKLREQDRFTFSLSGGSTPKKLYKLLSAEPFRSRIAWEKIHFFWGDERFVPFSDERNNARMAYEELLDKVPVNKNQIHIMRTELSPEDAVIDYEKILHQYFDSSPATFDLVILGLGDNAHTLSLFPGYEVIHIRDQWVYAFYLEEQSMHRITLTAPVVNQSAKVIFMVNGADKAPAVKAILQGEENFDLYPAQVIQPVLDEALWFLDDAAASMLL